MAMRTLTRASEESASLHNASLLLCDAFQCIRHLLRGKPSLSCLNIANVSKSAATSPVRCKYSFKLRFKLPMAYK
jgi:hypothetical protein